MPERASSILAAAEHGLAGDLAHNIAEIRRRERSAERLIAWASLPCGTKPAVVDRGRLAF